MFSRKQSGRGVELANVLYFRMVGRIIINHMSLLLELENVVEEGCAIDTGKYNN